ncbi:MAG: hypothetical protein ACI9G1_001285 [Pirellulaceae bacterium]|jgi:hypothetical protein
MSRKIQTVRRDGLLRRDFLSIGALSAFGLSLDSLIGGQQSVLAAAGERPARSCILIWLDGGPSHLETFDLKPDAPKEVRGPLESIATSVPGVQLSECLPQLARRMDDVAIIRSMTSPLGEHNFGTHYLLTGFKPTPALQYPAFHSVATQLWQRPQALPQNIAVPNYRVGGSNFSGSGYLPDSAKPFSVESDPAKPDFKVDDLEFFPGVNSARLSRRQKFVQQLDRYQQTVAEAKDDNTSSEFEQAFRLLTSPEAKHAFDLSAETPETRQRYGPRTVGQSCLLARRLVERGVPLVTVSYKGWDTHNDLYTRLKEGYTGAKHPVGLIPSLDLAVSALIDDLKDRRLLDETLIVVMGEFGRTPKLNTAGGRDHWPRVFSVALAGGGVRGGQVIGSSDSVGESPRDNPVTPSDLVHSIYSLLGIAPDTTLHTADGRPVVITPSGSRLIKGLSS